MKCVQQTTVRVYQPLGVLGVAGDSPKFDIVPAYRTQRNRVVDTLKVNRTLD